MILLAALGAVLAARACDDDRTAAPGAGEGSFISIETGTDDGSDVVSIGDRPRDHAMAPAAGKRPQRPRAAPPTSREPDPVLEEPWFNEPVAQWETEKRIDLTGAKPGVLVAKWIAMSDSGVELERRSGGKTLWRVHVQPLGIEHSRYHQEVAVEVDGDHVVVESVGAQKIAEVRDLATGAQISREVTDLVR